MGDVPSIHSYEWLKECSSDLFYEYSMMLVTTYIRSEDPLWQNVLLESSRIHWRSLACFFFAGADGVGDSIKARNVQGSKPGDSDIVARHFLDDWRPSGMPGAHFLNEYDRTHKQIAHLTLYRARQRKPHYGDGHEHLNAKNWHLGDLAGPITDCMCDFLPKCATTETARRRIGWESEAYKMLEGAEQQLLAGGVLPRERCATYLVHCVK